MTRYGVVQVQVVITDGAITDVTALEYPQTDRKDIQINTRALPLLKAQVLAAQSAKIDGVSGATFTSDGYVTSLQSALDAAGFTPSDLELSPGLTDGRIVRTAMIMGLPFSVHLRSPAAPGPMADHSAVPTRSQRAIDAAVEAVWDGLRWADGVFSTYRQDSDISRIRRGDLLGSRRRSCGCPGAGLRRDRPPAHRRHLRRAQRPANQPLA